MITKLKKIASIWPIFLIAYMAWYSYILWLGQDAKNNELSNSIEAKDVIVSSKVSGRIKEVLIEEGEHVKKGDVFLILEGDELIAQQKQATASYEESIYRLSDLKQGARKEEIAQAVEQKKSSEALFQEAQINFKNKNADYVKMEALYNDGAISKKDFDRYRTDRDSSEQILLARSHDFKRSIEYEKLLKAGPRNQEVAALSALTKLHKSKEEELNKYVSELTVVSPIDGQISSFDLEVGEYVSSGNPIATVTDLNDMYVRVYVPTTDLHRLKINKDVILKADGYPNQNFHGKIKFISPKAEFTPRNIQTAEERSKLVYQVKIEIDNKDSKLRNGMYVTVNL